MSKKKIKLQNDVLYLLILIFVTEFFNSIVNVSDISIVFIIGGIGLLLLETWFVRVFSIYSGKKVSKYSDVIVKISLKERFFSYFILPAIFYVSLLAFLYFNKNEILGHFALGISMSLLLILFLNIKSSLNKIYTIANTTRAIFDFICITIFYLVLNVLIRLGLTLPIFLLSSFISVFILLFFILKLHDRLGWVEHLVSLFSSIFIVISLFIFWNSNIFVIPAIGALAFYLVVSLWNIRFSGKIYLLDYLVPFLYVIIALVLILNI